MAKKILKLIKIISKIYSRKNIENPINTIKTNYLFAIRQVVRKT
jgi:hypothetical protein